MVIIYCNSLVSEVAFGCFLQLKFEEGRRDHFIGGFWRSRREKREK